MTEEKEDRGPRCTAGWSLVGVKKIAHDMFMLNELKGGYGAYEISYAGAKDPQNNQSGLSYGPNQRDMSKRPTAVSDFVDILNNATDKNGKLIFTKDEVKRLCGKDEQNIREIHKTPKQIFGKDLDRVNTALSSKYGMRKINEVYMEDLRQDMVEIEAFINKIKNAAARLFYMSDYGKAYLFDFKNKFGLSTDQKEGKFLHDYLNGCANRREREDYTTHEKYTASITHYGVADHLKFIYGTKEWAIHNEDVVRRLDNAKKVLVDKYKLSDANPYCKLEVFKYSAYDLGVDNDNFWNDAIFDDFNSGEECSFAIYEDISQTWDRSDVHSDYELSMDMRSKLDVKVDPIEHASTIDSPETIDDAIETMHPSVMNAVELTHTDVLELDSDLNSIANSTSQTPILTELELPCSTPVDMGFLVEATNYIHPDPVKNVFEDLSLPLNNILR